jgi:hypothetical protein
VHRLACATEAGIVSSERFSNTYHNASTAPTPDVPADLSSFMLAADPVLAEAAELALRRRQPCGHTTRRPSAEQSSEGTWAYDNDRCSIRPCHLSRARTCARAQSGLPNGAGCFF